MTKRIIETLCAPAAIGPYSQAVQVDSLLFVSGQIALNPETGEFQNEDIAQQTERALQNLKAVITAAGGTLDNVIKTTVYLADMNEFVAMNEVYSSYFSNTPPARACVEVSRLPKDAKVEVDAIVKL